MWLDVPIRGVDGLPDAIKVGFSGGGPRRQVVRLLRCGGRYAGQQSYRNDSRGGGPYSKPVSHPRDLLWKLVMTLSRIIPANTGDVKNKIVGVPSGEKGGAPEVGSAYPD